MQRIGDEGYTINLQNVLCSDRVFLAADILKCGSSKHTVSKSCPLIPLENKSPTLHIQKA